MNVFKHKLLSVPVVIVVAIVVLALLVRFIPKSDERAGASIVDGMPNNEVAVLPEQQTQNTSEYAKPAKPVQINIPAIDVSASIDYVGVNADGLMDITENPETVAWYEPGARPGDRGSAVMAGHYGTWQNGSGSVFDDLHTLKKGDKVYVTDKKGAKTTFVVRESRRFAPDAETTEIFTSNDGKAHLNLITCEGSWNDSSQSYSRRLVVFTDQE